MWKRISGCGQRNDECVKCAKKERIGGVVSIFAKLQQSGKEV